MPCRWVNNYVNTLEIIVWILIAKRRGTEKFERNETDNPVFLDWK